MAGKSSVFRFADYEVHEGEFSLVKAGETLPVEPKAFRVLLILLRNPKKLIPKEELLNAVWGDAAVTENSLTRVIAMLRRLLDDDAREPRFIETVTSVGYRWLCPVELEEVPGADAREAGTQAAPEMAEAPVTTTAKSGARRRWAWIASAVAAAVLLLAASYRYLSRPLPPPRITAYTQITHDGRLKDLGATDGERLYFALQSPNQIAEVGVNGGEIARLPVALAGSVAAVEDVSPDGSHVLASTIVEGQVADAHWLVPLLGGAVKRLDDGFDGAAFSPDGGSVIDSTLSGDIFMTRIDGSGTRKLASVGSPAYRFRWSPNGKMIRFSKQGGLWEMSGDGTGIHRLLPDWKEGIPDWGNWTRDGNFFVFAADGKIWALDERRSVFRQPSSIPMLLAGGPIHWDQPAPGKDGNGILFAKGSKLRGELTRLDLKTGAFQPFLDGISAEYVSFSPDGKYVAYVAFPEGTLWRANLDGSNRMQLTQPPGYVVNPHWSPDSQEILFGSEDPPNAISIHRVSASDGTPRWLPYENGVPMFDPNWSPDGTRVVFERGALEMPGAVLHALNTAEGLDFRIADLGTRQVTVVPQSRHKWSPRWSPDGRYLVALVYPQIDHLELFDMKLQRWSDIPIRGEVNFPCFSRDSRFIYFVGSNQGVFRIPVAGGRQERVFDMAGWHLGGHYGLSMSLDPTDAPLVLRDTGSDDIYALTLEER